MSLSVTLITASYPFFSNRFDPRYTDPTLHSLLGLSGFTHSNLAQLNVSQIFAFRSGASMGLMKTTSHVLIGARCHYVCESIVHSALLLQLFRKIRCTKLINSCYSWQSAN